MTKMKTTDETLFKDDMNAWNVVLDVDDRIASFPFLFSRNYLAGETTVPPPTGLLDINKLGDPNPPKSTEPGKTSRTMKLDFDKNAVVVITKAGTGFLIKKRDFENTDDANSNAKFNPEDYKTSEPNTFVKPK